MNGARRFGVLLMTYGSPSSSDDLPRYLTAVRGGRPPDAELVAEFARRYDVIGGSPLIPITIAQAAAVERRLGGRGVVRAAMRFSEPSIRSAVEELGAADVDRIVGIVLSPQYSPMLMSGYARELEAAIGSLPGAAPEVTVAGSWHCQPAFIGTLARRVTETLAGLPEAQRQDILVLLTAHSLPRRVAEDEPDYLAQLEETAAAVADAAGLGRDEWLFCWQSAGHQPGEWMQPDLADQVHGLPARGRTGVLVAPIQFLADHLEVLYDIDVGARKQAEEAGVAFHRIPSLNVDEGLIEALATVASETLRASAARPVVG